MRIGKMTLKQVAVATVLAAVIGLFGVIYTDHMQTIREGEDEEAQRQRALEEEKRAQEEKKAAFVTELVREATLMKEALVKTRDAIRIGESRDIRATRAQLDTAHKNWARYKDEARIEAEKLFGAQEKMLVAEEAHTGLYLDKCGLLSRSKDPTLDPECKAKFLRVNRELQKRQDSINECLATDMPAYAPPSDIIVASDLHTSFRIAKDMIEFHQTCAETSEVPEQDPVGNRICHSKESTRFAMQQRVNIAGQVVDTLAQRIRGKDPACFTWSKAKD